MSVLCYCLCTLFLNNLFSHSTFYSSVANHQNMNRRQPNFNAEASPKKTDTRKVVTGLQLSGGVGIVQVENANSSSAYTKDVNAAALDGKLKDANVLAVCLSRILKLVHKSIKAETRTFHKKT